MRSTTRAVILTVALGTFLTSATHAALYNVQALSNSSSGGTPLSTITLTIGQLFTVTVDPNDLWSAGALPRWSNADGLTHNLYATGSDESGQSAGTLIGKDFGLWTQDGHSAPYGKLVGKIGSQYIDIGTSYSGVAPASGVLQLMYWDSNSGDNVNQVAVTANVTVVPEPSTWMAGIMGLVMCGGLGLRSRRDSHQTAS